MQKKGRGPFPMMAKPMRVKRRYALMRQEIVQAARQLIREKGIDGLSMRAIAKLVHTSPANLYEYFLNKEEIIVSVYNDFLVGLLETLQAVHSDSSSYSEASGRAYLLALCMQYIDYVGQDPSQLQIASYPTQLEMYEPTAENVDNHPTEPSIPSMGSIPHSASFPVGNNTAGDNHATDNRVSTAYLDPMNATYVANTQQIFALFLQAVEKCIQEKTISSPTLNAHDITHIIWAFVHGLVTLSIHDVSIIDRNTMHTAIVNFLDGLSS